MATPRRVAAALAVALATLTTSACADFVVEHPTPRPVLIPEPSLPPIGFNHRYGNSPVSSADGFAYERALFAAQIFWEVGLRTDPQVAGFVDRSDPAAVTRARAAATSLQVAIATERLPTIQGMLALSDAAQQQYCVALVEHFRTLGYSHITSAKLLVFFTEADEHAQLTWTASAGYAFTIYDNDLRGNALRPGPSVTPLPAPT